MGADNAILYSDGASTCSSTVAAFCKRGDLLVVDNGIDEPLRTGITLSRAHVKWFQHNDMKDLCHVLEKVRTNDVQLKRKPNEQRRFIIVQGVYGSTGSIAHLDRIVQLKHQYKFRLILDESLSFGTLGSTGKGIMEMFNARIMHDVEIVTISLENAMGSIGGITVGSEEVVDHQRLSGSGYCFSASSPPFTAAAAIQALERLRTNPELVQRLQDNCIYLHRQVNYMLSQQTEQWFTVISDERSPLLIVQINNNSPEAQEVNKEVFWAEVVRECLQNGVAFVVSKPWIEPSSNSVTGSNNNTNSNPTLSAAAVAPTSTLSGSGTDLATASKPVEATKPTTPVEVNVTEPVHKLRITVSATHTYEEIDRAVHVLKEALDGMIRRFYEEENE